jgi:hypothetical protein
MTPVANAMVGDANNRIERCTDASPVAACAVLPGALLVTSSGTSSPSDPAIEYTAPGARVIQLVVRAAIPSDSVEHRVRLYRGSREDVLYTAVASPGVKVEHAITVDALPGDRFLVALEPTGTQGGAAALHFFVIDAITTFPSTCQLALTFDDPAVVGPSAAAHDLCGPGGFTYVTGTMPGPLSTVAGPYSDEGPAVYFEPGFYLYGSQPLDQGDTTIQFWVLSYDPTNIAKTWVFSNIDAAVNAHGLGINFQNPSATLAGLKLEASFVSATNPVTYTGQSIDFANGGQWHFVRVVHAGNMVTFCVDGTQVKSSPLADTAASGTAPHFGKNGPTDVNPDFYGALDDVRVFSDALPCNP